MSKYTHVIESFRAATHEQRPEIAAAASLIFRTKHPRVNGGGRAAGLLVDILVARNGVVLAQSRARVTPGYTYASDGVMLHQITP